MGYNYKTSALIIRSPLGTRIFDLNSCLVHSAGDSRLCYLSQTNGDMSIQHTQNPSILNIVMLMKSVLTSLCLAIFLGAGNLYMKKGSLYLQVEVVLMAYCSSAV